MLASACATGLSSVHCWTWMSSSEELQFARALPGGDQDLVHMQCVIQFSQNLWKIQLCCWFGQASSLPQHSSFTWFTFWSPHSISRNQCEIDSYKVLTLKGKSKGQKNAMDIMHSVSMLSAWLLGKQFLGQLSQKKKDQKENTLFFNIYIFKF